MDDVARCVTAGYAQRLDWETENFVATRDVSGTLTSSLGRRAGQPNDDNPADYLVAHSLRPEGFDASEDGTGRGTPLVPVSVAIRGRDEGGAIEMGDDVAHALRASQGGGDKPHVLAPIAFNSREDQEVTFDRSGPLGSSSPQAQAVATPVVPYDFFNITAPVNRQNRKDGDPCHTLARDNADRATLMLGDEYTGWAVRRLTPTECARLQGFNDHHCRIPWRGKPAEQCPDGPQYKAYGNSMSTNVMRWIGERIQFVDQIERKDAV